MDALRELRRLADRLLDVSSHVLDRGLRSLRVGVHLHARELEVDGERHEVLLHAPVQLALDRAALGVGREDEPLARRAQPCDLAAQLVERHVERVVVHGRSCASSRRRSQGASTRVVGGTASRPTRLLTPWSRRDRTPSLRDTR